MSSQEEAKNFFIPIFELRFGQSKFEKEFAPLAGRLSVHHFLYLMLEPHVFYFEWSRVTFQKASINRKEGMV